LNLTVTNETQGLVDALIKILKDGRLIGEALGSLKVDLGTNANYNFYLTKNITTQNLSIEIKNSKITKDLTKYPQIVKNYQGYKPNWIQNITVIFALNDTDLTYDYATLYFPKEGINVNRIMHCLDWDFSAVNCSSWDIKLPNYYNAQENSTHIWFNVSHFYAYAGGLGYNSNLTIWDDTDLTTKYVDEQIYFYANYTNATSGESINNTNVYCNITFNISGTWTPWETMLFNTTSLLYQYNRSFTEAGTFNWNVSCNGSALGYDPLNATDTVVVSSAVPDTTPPTYSLNSTNSTLAGTPVSHNLYWQDNVGLSYAIFSFDNCTGSLQNITGMSLSGSSAWSNFTVVINSTVGCTIRWCVYANDTSNNWNGSSCLTPFSYVTTSPAVPYLEVSLITPDPTLTKTNIIQNLTFWVNATVTCRGGDCGEVNGTVRYNSTSPYPDTPINETYGATPFFINETPAQAMKSCGNLLQDQSCNLSWLINATGEINSGWKIGVLFNSSLASVQQNHTSNATVLITSCTIDMTTQFSSINFGTVNPSTQGNNATGNDGNIYNITVNPGSCNLDIYINATDLINATYNSRIGVGNFTFSNTTNNYANSYQLSYLWQLIRSNVPPLTNVTTWYWLNVPPIYAGYYIGNVTIKGVLVGEQP